MRRLSLLLLGVSLLAFTAAAAEDLAGAYAGEWNGGSAAGELRLTLRQDGKEWKAEASFTIGGQEVKTNVKRVKVDGAKIEIEYEFDLQGAQLKSTLTGEQEGRTLKGKYHTVTADGSDVDDGAWKVTAK